MNLSIHIISGGILAAIVFRFVGAINSAIFFCFASFLDIDHYIYYIMKFHRLHIGKAYDYFNSYKNNERFCICIFHTVEFLILFSLITYFTQSVFLKACFMGFLVHCIFDVSQGLYYRRMHYRWWSIIRYLVFIKNNRRKY